LDGPRDKYLAFDTRFLANLGRALGGVVHDLRHVDSNKRLALEALGGAPQATKDVALLVELLDDIVLCLAGFYELLAVGNQRGAKLALR